MMPAVAGVCQWANATWRQTRDALAMNTASAWLARLQASLPRLNVVAWQAGLALVAVPLDPSEATEAVSRRARPGAPRFEKADRSSASAKWIRPRERSVRRPAHAAPDPRVLVVEPQKCVALLRPYSATWPPAVGVPSGRRGSSAGAAAVKGLRDEARPSGFGGARSRPVASRSETAWRRRLVSHVAERFATHSNAAAEWPAVDRASLEDVLVKALDQGVEGVSLSADALQFAATVPPSGASPAAHESETAGTAPPGWNEIGRPASAESPPAVTRARPRSREGIDPVLHPLTSHQDVDAGPLLPVGLATPESAPAPDVPISVAGALAGSVSRVSAPSGAPSLPPLVPAAVTAPPSFGLSAPSMRQATRAEDPSAPDDDVSALADRIRRILRDEARRHGVTLQ